MSKKKNLNNTHYNNHIEGLDTKPAAYSEAIFLLAVGGIFSYLKPAYGIPTLIVLFCISALLLWKAYKRVPIWFPIILVIFCTIGVLVSQNYLNEYREPNFTISDDLSKTVYQNEDIKISDLAENDFVIRNKTFKHCNFYGPAVIHFLDNTTLIHIYFVQPADDLLFLETLNKRLGDSIIIFKDCTILNSNFHRVSIIGLPGYIKDIKQKIGFDVNGVMKE